MPVIGLDLQENETRAFIVILDQILRQEKLRDVFDDDAEVQERHDILMDVIDELTANPEPELELESDDIDIFVDTLDTIVENDVIPDVVKDPQAADESEQIVLEVIDQIETNIDVVDNTALPDVGAPAPAPAV